MFFSLALPAGQLRVVPPQRFPLVALTACLLITGCHARTPQAAPAVSVRSTAFVPSAIGHVQSSPLYQQARTACTRHDYKHAAELLGVLSKTPGLAPEAVAFVQQQRSLCLTDAGLATPPAPTTASLPARTPALTSADCGPRALLLVCQQLGIRTNLQTLRRTAGTTAQGTSLAGLQQAAQKLGLQAQGVQVDRDALPDTALPAIAWDRRQHFIVLRALSGRGDSGSATIHDPNHTTEQTISQEQLLQRSGGYLLLLHR